MHVVALVVAVGGGYEEGWMRVGSPEVAEMSLPSVHRFTVQEKR